MARVVSISYDEHLLRTRGLMLQAAGHSVTSVGSYQEAMAICAAERFDLAVIGHSIPKPDKLALIECFRKVSPGAKVVALARFGEDRLDEADCYVDPWLGGELIHSVAWLTRPGSRPAK